MLSSLSNEHSFHIHSNQSPNEITTLSKVCTRYLQISKGDRDFEGTKSIFYLLNFHVNSSVREEATQNFPSGQALPLRAWFDASCRIVE